MIQPLFEAFYIEGMLFNTHSALASAGHVADAIDAIPPDSTTPENHIDQERLLDEAQNLVIRSASLSRYFWPIRKDESHVSRAKQLREAFGVTETSSLKNSDLRHQIEHFDEKLDHYLAKGIIGVVLPQYVGMSFERDGAPPHIFRAYYLDRGIFEVLGVRLEIQPIADEVLRLHGLLLACAENGGRFPVC